MDREKDLIAKLSRLKKIEPRNSWVIFAKTNIQNEANKGVEQKLSLFKEIGHLVSYVRIPSGIKVLLAGRFLYLERPAYIFAVLAFVVFGGVGYKVSQNSLPGDTLYPVRSAIEKITIGSDSSTAFKVAERRLQDLRRVVEGNMVKNLASATEEFNKSVAEVSKGLLALVENEPKKALQVTRELVQLQKGKAEIEQILGAVIGEEETSELINAIKVLIEGELNDLQTRTLTSEQKELLKQAIEQYQAQEYQQALENIWMISN